MKKIAIKFSAVVLMAVCLTSCNKEKNTPPEADKEFQSSIDASAAMMIATDIDMMVAQSSENLGMVSYGHYLATAGNNTVTVDRNDTLNKKITLTFNNAKCLDGKVRNGSILIDFAGPQASTYIRNPGHISNLTFINYAVGPYKLKNNSTFKISNTTPAGYTKTLTPMTWKLEGELLIMDTTETSGDKDMTWKGTLNKTLTNSTSNTVHPATNLALVWTTTNNAVNPNAINAKINYTGVITGVTKKDEAYTFTIDDDKPLYRNFGCSPDYYINPGHHPFTKGKAIFKTGGEDKSRRFVYFGDQDNNDACNNSGIVIINGVSYNVDFIQ